MSDPYLGEIRMVGFNFAPNGWALCDGQLLPISQYTALFSLLGTSFGGNGQTTFALPDLRGRVPVHQGAGLGLSPYVMGQMGGEEKVTLTVAQIAQHNHTVGVKDDIGNVGDPTNAVLAEVNTSADPRQPKLMTLYSNQPPTKTMAPSAVSMTGANQPHTNIQPYLCVNFIIALVGIYPSRS